MGIKVAGVIQARMGSTRLPGKVMKPLAGRPLIWHIADRLRRTRGVGPLVLATTIDPRNDPMAAYAVDGLGIVVVRAEREDDIVARLCLAAAATGADAVLKVNGDCPLVDPDMLGLFVERYLAEPGLDYVSNKIEWSWPLGFSAELISRKALEHCDAILTTDEERELVCNWIRDHPDLFRRSSIVRRGDNLSHLDLAVDTPEQYREMQEIFTSLYREGESFGLDAVLAYLGPAARKDGSSAGR
jgi:spore coat polysaccharide biosynthesis protein SpsF